MLYSYPRRCSLVAHYSVHWVEQTVQVQLVVTKHSTIAAMLLFSRQIARTLSSGARGFSTSSVFAAEVKTLGVIGAGQMVGHSHICTFDGAN